MTEELNPTDVYKPKLDEVNELSKEKKDEFDKKLEEKLQAIDSLVADLEALQKELSGQSQEYIDRKTKSLQEKINKQKESVDKWAAEQQKKIDDFINTKTEAVKKEMKKMAADILFNTEMNKHIKSKMANAADPKKPIYPEPKRNEDPNEDNKTPEISSIPKSMDDLEWGYSYKDSKGDYVYDLGTNVAKRKRYKGNIYLDDAEKLNKANIKRKKFFWGFSWDHTVWNIKGENGSYKLIPVQQESGSSQFEPFDNIGDVFLKAQSEFRNQESAARKYFSEDPKRRVFEKTVSTKPHNDTQSDWKIKITRFFK